MCQTRNGQISWLIPCRALGLPFRFNPSQCSHLQWCWQEKSRGALSCLPTVCQEASSPYFPVHLSTGSPSVRKALGPRRRPKSHHWRRRRVCPRDDPSTGASRSQLANIVAWIVKNRGQGASGMPSCFGHLLDHLLCDSIASMYPGRRRTEGAAVTRYLPTHKHKQRSPRPATPPPKTPPTGPPPGTCMSFASASTPAKTQRAGRQTEPRRRGGTLNCFCTHKSTMDGEWRDHSWHDPPPGAPEYSCPSAAADLQVTLRGARPPAHR